MSAPKYLFNLDLSQNELQNARLQNLGAHPASPVVGQVYFNTADTTVYVYLSAGLGWKPLRSAAGTGPIVVTIQNGVDTVSITAATASVAGSMSAADKAKLDGGTANATPNTIAQRDGAGNLSVATLTATKVTGLTAPTATNDAATKDYVDTLVNTGVRYKASVRVASTANITLSGLQNIDGVALAANDRVLVKNQTTATQNGIYLVSTGAWTRTVDFAVGTFGAGVQAWVNEGTISGDTGWVCISDSGADVVGTNTLTFTQSSGVGSVATSATLEKVNGQLGVVNYTPVASTVVGRVFVAAISIGGATPVTVTHNLSKLGYSVTVEDATTGQELGVLITKNANSCAITANGASTNVRVTIIG